MRDSLRGVHQSSTNIYSALDLGDESDDTDVPVVVKKPGTVSVEAYDLMNAAECALLAQLNLVGNASVLLLRTSRLQPRTKEKLRRKIAVVAIGVYECECSFCGPYYEFC